MAGDCGVAEPRDSEMLEMNWVRCEEKVVDPFFATELHNWEQKNLDVVVKRGFSLDKGGKCKNLGIRRDWIDFVGHGGYHASSSDGGTLNRQSVDLVWRASGMG